MSSAERNRELWDRWSDDYQTEHGPQLDVEEPAWGAWSLLESELRILGDVAGKDVLELGCGAAQWSIRLALRGARCIGLDNSARQLEHAQHAMAAAGVELPLVHAAAEAVPLPDGSFDLVFCDHGALSWGDPYRVVPEAARLLRPGGLLAFNMQTPLASICFDPETEELEPRLHGDYFALYALEEPGGGVTFNLPYGEWIRLLRRHGLVVEDLVELRPPEGATTTYGYDLGWARRWPLENVWKARKPA